MSKQFYRVRANRGAHDEIVQADDPHEAAQVLFDLAEERRRPVDFAHVNRLRPPDDEASGLVHETTDEAIIYAQPCQFSTT
jgi:hypothetical protein